MDKIAAFFSAHPHIAWGLSAWIALATFANLKLWPKSPDMPKWLKVVHFILIDLPAIPAAPGYRGYLGRLGIPFLSWSFGDGEDK